MDRRHPFDAIDFNGDGRGVPGVEPEHEVLRVSWRAMNAAQVPRIR